MTRKDVEDIQLCFSRVIIVVFKLSDLKNDQSIAVDPNESVGVAVDLKKPVGLKEASQKFFK